MTTPTGSPIWTRATVAADYGGKATLHDYGDIGSVNANTDVNAAQYLRLCADLSAVAKTAPLCQMVIHHTGGAWLVTYCKPLWAPEVVVAYDGATPPSSAYPSVIEDTASTCGVEFPATPTGGDFSETGALIIRAVFPAGVSTVSWQSIDDQTFVLEGLANNSTPCTVLVF